MKEKRKHIWKCDNCGARIKSLGSTMTIPKECPSCKSTKLS